MHLPCALLGHFLHLVNFVASYQMLTNICNNVINIAFINRVVPTFGKIHRAPDLLPAHGREGGWDEVEDFLAVVTLQGPSLSETGIRLSHGSWLVLCTS